MPTDQPRAAREALTRAEELAGEAVDTAGDGHIAFRIATELAAAWQATADRVSHLRGRAAARIKDEESLTLRGLADRIDVAPSRAHRMITEAPKAGGTSE